MPDGKRVYGSNKYPDGMEIVGKIDRNAVGMVVE